LVVDANSFTIAAHDDERRSTAVGNPGNDRVPETAKVTVPAGTLDDCRVVCPDD